MAGLAVLPMLSLPGHQNLGRTTWEGQGELGRDRLWPYIHVDQSTRHYIKECKGIKEDLFQGLDREAVYEIIQTLECPESTFNQVTQILIKVYYHVTT